MEFKDILRRKRKYLGLSQKQLEDDLGLNKGNISKYEKGENKPTLETLTSMAELFSCSIDELLGLRTISISRDIENKEKIKVGLKEIELSEFDSVSLGDLDKLLSYIEEKLGIELNRRKK